MSFTKRELEELLGQAKSYMPYWESSIGSHHTKYDFAKAANPETVRKLVEAVMGLSEVLKKIRAESAGFDFYVETDEALEKWGVKDAL